MPADRAATRRAGAALNNPASGLSLGIVVGLAAEARIARRLNGKVAIGGGTSAGARKAAFGLGQAGATALVSFGLAGGLDPALRPGDVVVPDAVLSRGQRYPTDPALCGVLGGCTPHTLLGADRIVVEAAEKQALWRSTGCAAVDLESGPVAEIAATCGIPFAVLRAVCDPASLTLPPAALAALDPHGALSFGLVLKSLTRRPGQLADLLTLASDAVRARRALLRRVSEINLRARAPLPG
jgi:adenosylhomocysteine nucleosidase